MGGLYIYQIMKDLIKNVLLETISQNEISGAIDSTLNKFLINNPNVDFDYKIKPNTRREYPVVEFTINNFKNGVLNGNASYQLINKLGQELNQHYPTYGKHPIKFFYEFRISQEVLDKFLNTEYIRNLQPQIQSYGIDNITTFFEDFNGQFSPTLQKLIQNETSETKFETVVTTYLQSLTDVPLEFRLKVSKNFEEVFVDIYPKLTIDEFHSCKYKKWEFDDSPLFISDKIPIQTQLNVVIKNKIKGFANIRFDYKIVWPREIGNFITNQNSKIRNSLSEEVLENVSVVVDYNICSKKPKFIIGYKEQTWKGGWKHVQNYVYDVVFNLERLFPDMENWSTTNRYWNVKKMYDDSNKNYWDKEKLFNYFLRTAIQTYGDIYEYDITKFESLEEPTQVFCKKHQQWFEVTPKEHLKGKRCPHDNESQGEKLVRVFLENKGVKFKMYHRITDCFSELNGRCYTLPFDFYLPDFNILIEYDGEQHYKPVEIWGGEKGFENQKRLDAIKNKFASDSGMTLIRIPYTVKKESQLLSYLTDEILKKK